MPDFQPRAVIFDMDGTLINTFPAIVRGWNAAMEPLFDRTFSAPEVVSRFGLPDEKMLRASFPSALSSDEQSAAIERYFAAYRAAHEEIAPFEGIESLLHFLSEREVPLGVMTGKGRRACDATLDFFGWTTRFGSVVTGDEIERQKPDPQGPLLVARELDVAPRDCVFVGDSPADIGAAQNAGMFSVVAGWHEFYLEEIRALHPDLWPHSPPELQRWFEERLA